ncbi:MAG: hypothetical protein JW891_18450 [Candidatus Lokiarchaeota archaeon]|nr:hypothetical protein [Candidatus Lokiarchaeota archaeon]
MKCTTSTSLACKNDEEWEAEILKAWTNSEGVECRLVFQSRSQDIADSPVPKDEKSQSNRPIFRGLRWAYTTPKGGVLFKRNSHEAWIPEKAIAGSYDKDKGILQDISVYSWFTVNWKESIARGR